MPALERVISLESENAAKVEIRAPLIKNEKIRLISVSIEAF